MHLLVRIEPLIEPMNEAQAAASTPFQAHQTCTAWNPCNRRRANPTASGPAGLQGLRFDADEEEYCSSDSLTTQTHSKNCRCMLQGFTQLLLNVGATTTIIRDSSCMGLRQACRAGSATVAFTSLQNGAFCASSESTACPALAPCGKRARWHPCWHPTLSAHQAPPLMWGQWFVELCA